MTFSSDDTVYTWIEGEYDFTMKATYLPMTTAEEYWTDTLRIFITGSVNEFPSNLLNIYPNPTAGVIIVETTPELDRMYPSYRLFDVQGRLILERAEPMQKERMEIEAPAGTYFLEVTTREGSGRTYRIVKQ